MEIAAAHPPPTAALSAQRVEPPLWLAALALGFPTVAVALVAIRSPHWCLLPLYGCGLLTSWRALHELWRSRSVLHTATAVWAFLVHLVFVAPLLNLWLDYWVMTAPLPADMRPWMGELAIATLLGLIAMLGGQRLMECRSRPRSTLWLVDQPRFLLVGSLAILLSLGAGTLLYVAFDGFGGFVSAFERGLGSFTGWGPAVYLAGMLPVTAAAVALGALGDRPWLARLGVPANLLLFATCVLWAGLNGNRANTVLALLWGVIVWHHFVHPVRWTTLVMVAIELAAFLYLFGFYKDFGRAALHQRVVTVTNPVRRLPPTALPAATPLQPPSLTAAPVTAHAPPAAASPRAVTIARGAAAPTAPTRVPVAAPSPSPVLHSLRSPTFLLLLDLGRFDLQAVLVERFQRPAHPPFAWGRTYVAGALSPVPRRLYPHKPPGKEREGTEALLGRGSYAPDRALSNQFGLAGEAVLNFGPLAIPLVYGLFGLLLGTVSRLEGNLDRRDARWLLLAFAPMLLVRVLMIDSDNISTLLLHCYLLLVPLVWFGTRRVVGQRTGSFAGAPAP